MSLVRVSVLDDTIFAPDPVGNLDDRPYDPGVGRGRLGRFVAGETSVEGSPLHHYLGGAIAAATRDLAPGQPVAILVHGFLFDPTDKITADPIDTDNPHGRLFHFRIEDERIEHRHHSSSWPLGLGFEADDPSGRTGLAVAFGWDSLPSFASCLSCRPRGLYGRAYEIAGTSAWALVTVIERLAQLLPGRPLDIVCHSLGSRVVIRAIALAADWGHLHLIERLGRVVILGGAEYAVEAQRMERRLQGLNLARRPAIYNVVSREDAVLNVLAENFGPRTFGNSQVIGHDGLGVEERLEHWIDLQLDGEELRTRLACRGLSVAGDGPDTIWDHWYYYTHRGNMALYRHILRSADGWSIPELHRDGLGGVRIERWAPWHRSGSVPRQQQPAVGRPSPIQDSIPPAAS